MWVSSRSSRIGFEEKNTFIHTPISLLVSIGKQNETLVNQLRLNFLCVQFKSLECNFLLFLCCMLCFCESIQKYWSNFCKCHSYICRIKFWLGLVAVIEMRIHAHHSNSHTHTMTYMLQSDSYCNIYCFVLEPVKRLDFGCDSSVSFESRLEERDNSYRYRKTRSLDISNKVNRVF